MKQTNKIEDRKRKVFEINLSLDFKLSGRFETILNLMFWTIEAKNLNKKNNKPKVKIKIIRKRSFPFSLIVLNRNEILYNIAIINEIGLKNLCHNKVRNSSLFTEINVLSEFKYKILLIPHLLNYR